MVMTRPGPSRGSSERDVSHARVNGDELSDIVGGGKIYESGDPSTLWCQHCIESAACGNTHLRHVYIQVVSKPWIDL